MKNQSISLWVGFYQYGPRITFNDVKGLNRYNYYGTITPLNHNNFLLFF